MDPTNEPDGQYVRECDLCYVREFTETEHPEHRAWICNDCRHACHDFDDQGD
jgi:hypothetical protein